MGNDGGGGGGFASFSKKNLVFNEKLQFINSNIFEIFNDIYGTGINNKQSNAPNLN